MEKKLANNLGLKILSVVFAVLLWLVVVNIDDPIDTQVYRNIPVTIAHEEIITNEGKTYQLVDNTNVVSVVVKAKRSVLSKINASDIMAVADVRNIELEKLIPVTVTITGFEGKYEEVSASPKNVQLKTELVANNSFPIVVATKGTVRGGYVLGKLTPDPETIRLSGSESLINQVGRVVAQVNVSGLSENTTLEAELIIYDRNDNRMDPAVFANNLGNKAVTVKAELLHTKNVPVVIDTTGIIPKEGYTLSNVTYEPKKIQVVGTEAALNTLESIQIPAESLELNGIDKKTESVVDVTPYLPEGIRLVEENAGAIVVTASVERYGTKMIECPAGAIQVKNAPAKLKVSYDAAEELIFNVVGTTEQLGLFDIKQNVYIDLKDYKEEGTYKVPVQVTLPEGCSLERTVEVLITLEKQ